MALIANGITQIEGAGDRKALNLKVYSGEVLTAFDKKNLGLEGFSETEIVQYCEKIIEQTPIECFRKIGKNYYITSEDHNSVLTINSFTMTIITAKKVIK